MVDWLRSLPPKVQDKCLVRLERLEEEGHDLRRPEADYLRDDIYELRVRFQSVNYRMLYFFYGQIAAGGFPRMYQGKSCALPRDRTGY